jgi:hypothetical protein
MPPKLMAAFFNINVMTIPSSEHIVHEITRSGKTMLDPVLQKPTIPKNIKYAQARERVVW